MHTNFNHIRYDINTLVTPKVTKVSKCFFVGEGGQDTESGGDNDGHMQTMMAQCRAEQVLLRVCTTIFHIKLLEMAAYPGEEQDEYMQRCKDAVGHASKCCKTKSKAIALVSHPEIVQRAQRVLNAEEGDAVLVLMFPSKNMGILNCTQLGDSLVDSLVMEFERSNGHVGGNGCTYDKGCEN